MPSPACANRLRLPPRRSLPTPLPPQDYRSWLQWAVFERRQRNYEAAERCFQQGTAVAPGNPYLW